MTEVERQQHPHRPELRRRMRIMLICTIILFGGIFLYKMVMGMLLKHYMANQSQVVTVSTMKAGTSMWQPKIKAAGSLRAINGVNVTTELAGLVQTIYFTPGAVVQAGDVLVQLNADNDIDLLHSLQANLELAKITLARDQSQYKVQGVSKQVVDNDAANVKSFIAQVAQQQAVVEKKTIRAPFAGRLGINLINLGQYLNPGDAITMLQTQDPIYADFYVPQENIALLKVNQTVKVQVDGLPGREFTGVITTVNPGVDPGTRNVEVEATLANPDGELAPGMFAKVEAYTGAEEEYVTVPQTVVFFNPYGDLVYVVNDKGKDKKGNPNLVVNQVFVTTGETRGDQIKILKGLEGGELIVTSGQLKLKNNSQVVINNSVVPSDNPNPDLPNAH